jgi:succinate dehydrogenase / fumarate reductase cytochrome b subunit
MMGYRGGIGQWAWIFHRLTGIGVLAFLMIHILDTALIILGPDWYNRMIRIYRLPLFGLGEIALFGAVLYHALNGLRIVVIDFWPKTTRYHKAMWWMVLAVFVAVFVPVAGIMWSHTWTAR